MELFDDMEEVKGEQNARYPKATHGTEIEPIRPWMVIILRDHNANEAQYIQQLCWWRQQNKQ